MEKEFNVTGLCFPDQHYMADVSKKLEKILAMVEKGVYFIINRPRQYGKTTTLNTLYHRLMQTGNYIVIKLSFGGVGDSMFNDEKEFSSRFVKTLTRATSIQAPVLSDWLKQNGADTNDLESLSFLLTDMVSQTNKKVVLTIDEVDKSSNNQLFVSFLAMLREQYLERRDVKTFHSVVLAGLHDVKTLKLKLRPDEEKKLNSPWNIAADFLIDMNLNPSEIKPMLDEYCTDTDVTMNTQEVAERLFYHTSGYPFLVSKLCKTIAEDILPTKTEKTWTFDDIETSVSLLLEESNTNFDSLVKNLENNKDLYDFVYRIVVDAEVVRFNVNEPLIIMGLEHGIFKNDKQIRVHNRIYEQILYDYMTAKTTVAMKSHLDYGGHFTLDNDALDMQAALLKFQQFMKEEFSEKDKTFLEKQGRLVFLSFLAPILNGKGHSFKEVQISEEKRLDIVATYAQSKYIIELKRWYGEESHKKGVAQLADYLDIHSVREGFLVIFEYNKVKSWRKEWITHEGKRIFAVWV